MTTINLTPATGADHGPVVLSSTQASVDSDSDYQVAASFNAEEVSRPESRSSTFSGLSTTATKDGVEGNRIHRSHDPTGFTLFPTLTSASQRSDGDGQWSTASVSTIDSGVADSLKSKSELGDAPRTSSLVNDAEPRPSDPNENTKHLNNKQQHKIPPFLGPNQNYTHEREHDHDHDHDHEHERDHDHDKQHEHPHGHGHAHGHHHPAPPNEPDAPPVTLREKINLLRTGSVAGIESDSDFSLASPAPDNISTTSNQS